VFYSATACLREAGLARATVVLYRQRRASHEMLKGAQEKSASCNMGSGRLQALQVTSVNSRILYKDASRVLPQYFLTVVDSWGLDLNRVRQRAAVYGGGSGTARQAQNLMLATRPPELASHGPAFEASTQSNVQPRLEPGTKHCRNRISLSISILFESLTREMSIRPLFGIKKYPADITVESTPTVNQCDPTRSETSGYQVHQLTPGKERSP